MARIRNIHMLDYMDWLVGDMPRTQRARNVFGEGGRQSTSRATTNGRRRLQELYDSKGRSSSKFDPDELDEFRQIFEFYDVDNTKTMDLDDLIMALRALGFNPTEKDANDVINLMEVDDDTTLDFSEFCMVVEFLNHVTDEAGELRNAFRLVDIEEEGHVTSDDVIKMMTTHSEDMSLKQINEMVQFADTEKSGVINYDQLIETMLEDKEKMRRDNGGESYLEPIRNKKDRSKPNKKPRSAKSNGGERRNVEAIDSLVKALGGPILMVSAVIITANKKPESRWVKAKNLINKLKPQLSIISPQDRPSTST